MSDEQKSRDHTIEIDLMVECCRSSLTADQKEVISKFLVNELDWDYVLKLSNRNSITPLVTQNLENFSDQLPKAVWERLLKSRHVILQRNMFLIGKLVEVVRTLEENGIPTMPFKGPLLALQAYGDVGFRSYGDLDILVKPENLRKAVAILEEFSYWPISTSKLPNRWELLKGKRKDIYLRSEDGRVNLELHWKLSGSHFDLPIVTEVLWSRLHEIEIAGQKIKTLGFDDLLIYLCLHGSRHGWEMFGWICDVHELLRSREDIGWGKIIKDAREIGCERTLFFGLYLVHRFFGFEFEFFEWQSVKSDATFASYADQIHGQIFSETMGVMSKSDRCLYHLALKSNRWDRWKLKYFYLMYIFKTSVTPSTADKDYFNFPYPLTPLYIVARPGRLVVEFLQRRRK